jgi:tetratricopeptide (TPR) repeat protein
MFAQLAEELRKDGELREAIEVARNGLEKHPNYPSARMTLGRALMDAGQLVSARGEFESVLKGAPDNILASRFLAECLEGLGELTAAVARYKSTLLLSPDDRQVLARLEGAEGKLKRASRGATLPGPVVRLDAAGAYDELRPIPVAEVDGPMILETSREAGGFGSPGGVPSERLPDASSLLPIASLEESFEVEHVREAPVLAASGTADSPSAWEAVATANPEKVLEEDAATIPPRAAASLFAPAPLLPHADEEYFVEAEPLPVPRPAAESAALVSSTLAELYFNQGFIDKAIEVYRQLVEREPANQRAKVRLGELQELEHPVRAGSGDGRLSAGLAATPVANARVRRREVIQRTIARLEGLLAAARRG